MDDGDGMGGSQRGFLAHRGLIAVASGVAMAEAGLLLAVAPPAAPLAPQVSALAPLAIFHDLRWLYGTQHAWPSFALVLAVVLIARAALDWLLIRLAWPAGRPRPVLAAALRGSLAGTVLLAVVLSPVVSLAFGVAILPFSWPFIASLPALLVISLPLSHAGVGSDWWRRLPPVAAMGWLLADFLALSVAAALAGGAPGAAAVPLAGLTGLVNARAWYGVTVAIAPAPLASLDSVPATPSRVPLALIAAVTAIGVVIGATRLTFIIAAPGGAARPGTPAGAPAGTGWRGSGQAGQAGPGAGRIKDALASARGGGRTSRSRAVLVVPGFGSNCCGNGGQLAHLMPGTTLQQFSYRGLSPSGAPLPYDVAASNMPLPALGDMIAAQVRALHARTGRAVDVVAESEGTLGVDAMLAQHRNLPLGSVVLLSPIVAPGRVSYRPDRTDLIQSGQLAGVVWFVGGLSPYGSDGAQTLIQSVGAVGARFAAEAARRPVRVLQIVPLADALTWPVCPLRAHVLVVTAFHGQLLGNPTALSLVRDFLQHRPVPAPDGTHFAAQVLAAAAAAWRMPQTSSPAPVCLP